MNEQSRSKPVGVPVDWSLELERNQSWLRSVVAMRSGERQAVDEIMQEVAIAVVKQQAPLQDTSRIAPWLYQIAVRQSLMYRRKHGRRRNLEKRYAERLGDGSVSSQEPNPIDWLVADERRAMLREAMAKLNPKEAEILMLKYTEDWSYRQIAEKLGVSESAVESRLTRARKRLRQEMMAYELSGVQS